MKLFLKSLLLLIFSFSSVTSLLSQSDRPIVYDEIIIYKDFHYFNSRPFLKSSNYEPKSITSYGWSIGYKRMKNESKYNQFEAKIIIDNSNEASAPFNTKEILFNYRKGKYLKNSLFKVLNIRYGPSLNINLVTEDLEIGTNREFPTENLFGGIGLSVFGGIEYSLSDKLNVNVDTNLFGMSFSIVTSFYDNPVLTDRQKRQGGFDFDLFGERTLKIGIGYNIVTRR